jgi:hypothetical protein
VPQRGFSLGALRTTAQPQLETKYYIAGVGEVSEKVVAGGHERFRLVAVTH